MLRPHARNQTRNTPTTANPTHIHARNQTKNIPTKTPTPRLTPATKQKHPNKTANHPQNNQLISNIRSIGLKAATLVASGITIFGVRSRIAKYTFSNVFNRICGHSLQAQFAKGGAGINRLAGAAFCI
jgi:hypothetical protein